MVRLNKYLRELGVNEDTYPFNKDKNDSRYEIDEDVGLSEADTWEMDIVLAMDIYTYLRYFKDTNNLSYPCEFNDMQEWVDILDKMIEGFGLIITEDEPSNRQQKKIKKSLSLFKKYFFDLWW